MTELRRSSRVSGSRASVYLRVSAVAACLAAGLACGVLSSTRRIPPPPAVQAASRQDLLEKIRRFASIQSLRASVDVTLTVLSDDRDEETEWRNVRGALVTKRPGLIRTTAEAPGGLAKLYDMVSDGKEFRVYLPWRNRVFAGPTALTHISENRAENLRPQHIIDAIMLKPLPDESKTLLDFNMYGRSGYQVLLEVEAAEDGRLQIRRKYWFDRSNLALSRLMILDDEAELLTNAWYREWQESNSLPYPRFITIERPKDGYRLEMEILRPGLDEDVPEGAFELALPDGVETKRIGDKPSPLS